MTASPVLRFLSFPSSKVALRFQVLAQFLRIHVVRSLVDVDEIWPRACLRDCFRRRDEGIGNRDYCVTRPDSRGEESKAQGIRAIRHSNAVLGRAECRELALKLFHHRTANESRGVESLMEDLSQFFFQLLMGSD